MLLVPALLYGQAERKFIRQGNSQFSKGKYSESEVLYRKAIDQNTVPDASFNLGDALYKQKKYEDACKNFMENVNQVDNRLKKSNSFFNLGNSLLSAQKIKESIDAYKNSLKLNPQNQEAKYNLAFAQDLLKQQEQQQQQQNNKKDQQNKDNQEQNKDQQQQNQQQQQQNQQQDQQQQQQQNQQQQGISREDAQRLLDALANDEKNVQEKVKEAKAASQKVRVLINW